MSSQFVGKATPLSAAGLTKVTDQLHTKPAEIWAVLHVETAGSGFIADRRPQILFERHIFSKETNHKFDDHSDISNPSPGGYGAAGAHQYDRLRDAMKLDAENALRSASWGIGQIMGTNAQIAGFTDIDAMVAAMVDSEDSQLLAVAKFLQHGGLDKALQAQDWRTFARGYNGPNFEQNNYGKRLKAAFAQYSTLLPDLNLRAAQLFLTYLGLSPGAIDGVMGSRTRSALETFQQQEGLNVTGNADTATMERLQAKAG